MSYGKVFIDTIELRKINEKILVLIKEINLQDNKELKSSSLDLMSIQLNGFLFGTKKKILEHQVMTMNLFLMVIRSTLKISKIY